MWSAAFLTFVSLSNPDLVTVQHQLISASCDGRQVKDVSHKNPFASCLSLDTSKMKARLEAEGSRPFIAKKTFSNDRRIAFVAGLEGAGHHFWRDLFESCGRTGDCVAAPEVAQSLFNMRTKGGLFNHYDSTGNYDATVVEGVRSALHSLSSTEGLIWVNGAHKRGERCCTGMLSYPNYGGPEKINQHPDVWELAQIAEAHGEDLRIVVVWRQARSLLLADAVHRRFAPYGTAAVILAHNARVLAKQLQKLDAKFVRCVEYEHLPDLPADLSSWLDPSDFEFEAAAASIFKHEEHHQHKEALPADSLRDVAIAHLDAALVELHTAAGCPTAATE